MKIIGLTGGTGAGKSMLAEYYRKLGGFIIDADQLSHQVILKGTAAYDEIIGYFGSQILDDNKEINRRRLGDRVFNNPNDLAFLVQIIHHFVVEETKMLIENVPAEFAFILIDAPLLIEAKMHLICYKVILATAAEETRIKRVMERDNKSYEAVLNIIKNQMPFAKQQQFCDYVIQTDGSYDEVIKKADEVLRMILHNDNTVTAREELSTCEKKA